MSLRAELSDGVVLKFESSEFDGDYPSTRVSFAATDKEGKSIYENWVTPERYVSFTEVLPYEVTESVNLGPGKVDMLSITGAKNVGDLITTIKWPCIGVTYDLLHGDEEAHEDEEEYFLNESSREIIDNTLADFNQMADDCDEIMVLVYK